MHPLLGKTRAVSRKDDEPTLRPANGITYLTVNQTEKLNTIGFDMWKEIGAAMKDTRAVVLRGVGDKAFSAGSGLSEFKEHCSSAERRKTYNAIART